MTDKTPIRTRDIMQDNYLEMDGLATVAEALAIMKEKELHVVIVKKRNDDDEYGVVLLADIAKKVLAKDQAPERVNIYEIMSKPVVSVDPPYGCPLLRQAV